ncbi:MAG: plasmid recombination protein [Candidatus Fimousia sp.]
MSQIPSKTCCLKWQPFNKRKAVQQMASIDKFTHDAMSNMLRHNDRKTINPGNKDIDRERSALNYSFPLDYGGLTGYEYYKRLVDEKYLYGRGSAREKCAVTGCGWVVTLPKEIHGYPEKEKAFFKGVFDFISTRYGKENIINNAVHYDEAGLPHIHVIFSPVTKLNHDVVQYKTVKTTQAIKLASGRYEYTYRFKLNEKGEKIKLKNYARMSDYYDEKIDCNSVLNKIELRNFHPDLQKYLTEHGIEGAVITGKTGTNFTVNELKTFTAHTGMHLEEVKMLQGDKSLLESFVERDKKVVKLEEKLRKKEALIESLKGEFLSKNKEISRNDELSHKDIQIRNLSHIISEKEQELVKVTDRNAKLEKRIAEIEKSLNAKQSELKRVQARVEELEKAKTVEVSQADKEQGWRQSSSSWGDSSQSGWGTKITTFEEDKTW